MQECEDEHGVEAEKAVIDNSGTGLLDSGLGSSLLCMSEVADVAIMDVSRESGELTDEEGPLEVQPVHGVGADGTVELVPYNRFSYYVPRSLAERMVLENPPAPVLHGLREPPNPMATLITDRVGRNLTRKDKVIFMQNDVA